MTIVLIICVLAVLASLYFGFVRNSQVYNFRKAVLDDMLDDIVAGESIGVKLAAFQSVSYNAMVLQFWRPLNRHEWFHGTVLDK